ncbi:uncharacterized protein RJT21DRAFT_111528 [Scheffersomyces amazonensis]|uniref:uncharacterized protein n=1 Tax=Scheffersomyces amazonensis TaxID=1078765 RepID=UPI00315C86A7
MSIYASISPNKSYITNNHTESTDSDSDCKRRKLNHPVPVHIMSSSKHIYQSNNTTTLVNNSLLNSKNGTITPVFEEDQQMLDDEISSNNKENFECPCGYLHGPGQGNNHDITAVGFSSEPLLRGPE